MFAPRSRTSGLDTPGRALLSPFVQRWYVVMLTQPFTSLVAAIESDLSEAKRIHEVLEASGSTSTSEKAKDT